MIKALNSLPVVSHPMVAATIQLMRLDKPIGIFLVLWPALWALWIASEGMPSWQNLFIFVLGAVVMRSAGCVINDYADRDIDGHIGRTKHRPLAIGVLTPRYALIVFGVLLFIALGLVLMTNAKTIVTALGAVALTIVYPFMKRHTYLPQIVLGAAFAWAIPMAFTAASEELPKAMWSMYIAVLVWTVAYDTFYAMVDREDDLKIGVKSTAILFAENDRVITGSLQVFFLLVMVTVGTQFKLHWPYYLGLTAAAGLFGYQQYLIKDRTPKHCFKAFLNNNWVGMTIFFGLLLNYALYPITS